MSKLSIYETGWLNLVFEGKNKEYGAYQLRQENPRTTFFAFILGLLCIAVFAIVMLLASCDKAAAMPIPEDVLGPVIKLDNLRPNNPPVKKPVAPIETKQPKTPDPKVPLSNPVIVAQNPDNVAPNSDPAPTPIQTGPSTGTETPTTNPGTGTGTPAIPTPEPNNGPVIVAALDKLPEYPGGIQQFYRYIGDNFKVEVEDNMSVLMSFVIEKDGSITDIKVLRNPGYGLDREAIRVLKSLKTKWKPGFQNGQPVRTLYTLPIRVAPQN